MLKIDVWTLKITPPRMIRFKCVDADVDNKQVA